MSELVNDRVGIDFMEPEEPMGDITTHNKEKCKKDFDWDHKKLDECTQHEEKHGRGHKE